MWEPVSTAPKDRMIDVWCVWPDEADSPPYCPRNGIRFTDVAWLESGWFRMLDDGDYDFIEEDSTNPLGCPAWTITHWMDIPDSP